MEFPGSLNEIRLLFHISLHAPGDALPGEYDDIPFTMNIHD